LITAVETLFSIDGGGALRLSGNYTISTPVSVTLSSVHTGNKAINGYGARLISNLSSGYMMSIKAEALVRNFSIRGLMFVGGSSEDGGLKLDGGDGGSSQWLYSFTVEDIRMDGVNGNGVEITNNTFEGRLINVDIRNSSETTGYGIYLNEGTTGHVSSIHLIGCQTSGYYYGVYAANPVSDVQIYGGTYILAQKEGIHLATNQGQGVFGAHVENNWESAGSLGNGGAGLFMSGKGVISGVVGSTNKYQRYVVRTYAPSGDTITVIGGYYTGDIEYYLKNDSNVNGSVELIGSQTYTSIYGAGIVRRRGLDYQKCVTVSTSGTGEDDLMSYSVKGNSMGMYGGFKILAAGVKSGTAGNKTIKLYFGSSSVTVVPASNDFSNWRVEAYIFNRWSTGAQAISWVSFYGTHREEGVSTFSQDTTQDFTIKMTGECADAADTISQTLWVVERF